MRFSIITPSYNSALYLEQTIESVLRQQEGEGVSLEYIVVDGGSTDGSQKIIAQYAEYITHTIIEPDTGPANAINKGLRLASGDVIAWLNADDLYYPRTLERVRQALECRPAAAFCFGACPIVDEQGKEIRAGITRFKEFFYPFSSRFTYQCINYLSQPAMFFRRQAVDRAGLLSENMVAAWDYDFILRLWHFGDAVQVAGAPLSAFRWHEGSISGQNFQTQFQEEYLAAQVDAGVLSLQTVLHFFVRWGIVGAYSAMAQLRARGQQKDFQKNQG
ncbi:MAG: glycosyltransferase family 2 protein [Candidatus Electrothrix aestuarii]|uniref:Glycosyltransferase family 2 protein n=1 Tax=Candidatus Electrothrix aestuarii TaxID=3062594 RepID=A0AAU8LW91_9BACT|nr:glycosyltransferase family 2 protein [Candidatus Electrothrix aestuarii]